MVRPKKASFEQKLKENKAIQEREPDIGILKYRFLNDSNLYTKRVK